MGASPAALPKSAKKKITKPKLFFLLALIIAALAPLDLFLEKAEQKELGVEAQGLHTRGMALLKEGKPNEAVELLQRAYATERQNLSYQLDFIDALIAANKISEATPLMEESLQSEPNDGRANLIAARLAQKSGHSEEVEPYYHRAIYGHWSKPGESYRVATRTELVEYLIRTNRNDALLAELLPLEEETANDLAMDKRLAHWFLLAGSPSRAIDVYYALLRSNPHDRDAYSGLGEAQLAQGEYREAENAFLSAYRQKPIDPSLRQRIELSSTLVALDPTPRRISSAEKYRRSMRVLELTTAALAHCAESAPLLEEAQAALAARTPGNITNEAAEEKLALAEQVWKARLTTCGSSTTADEETLRLLMKKLAQ